MDKFLTEKNLILQKESSHQRGQNRHYFVSNQYIFGLEFLDDIQKIYLERLHSNERQLKDRE